MPMATQGASLPLAHVGISWALACFVQSCSQLKARHPLSGRQGLGFYLWEGGC